jgi:hypothetical protein
MDLKKTCAAAGHMKILDAVESAAKEMKEGK